MSEHLGHDKNKPVANASGNTRNGKSKKTLKGEFVELPIDIPRDRDGSFEPQITVKRWTMPVQNWKPVLNRFTIQIGEKMPAN